MRRHGAHRTAATSAALAVTIVLAGCATAPRPRVALADMPRHAAPAAPAGPAVAAAPALREAPVSRAPEARVDPVASRPPPVTSSPVAPASLAAANAAARQGPRSGRFEGARQIFAYAPGAIYAVRANPGFVSVILLEPGERITAIASGDTARWSVTEGEGEGAVETRAIVLVRPHAPGLRTNLVVLTERRTYLIEAMSQAGDAYAAEIAWEYPAAERASPRLAAPGSNARYVIRVTKGPRPVWTPVAVTDDGRRTVITFPPAAVAAPAPPLFVIGPDGAELVNYRVEPGRYVVDRLFDRAELRLGRARPQIVRIDRVGVQSDGRAAP